SNAGSPIKPMVLFVILSTFTFRIRAMPIAHAVVLPNAQRLMLLTLCELAPLTGQASRLKSFSVQLRDFHFQGLMWLHLVVVFEPGRELLHDGRATRSKPSMLLPGRTVTKRP